MGLIIPTDKTIEEIIAEYQKKSFSMSKKYFNWIGSLVVNLAEYIFISAVYLSIYHVVGFERTFILILLAIFVFVVRLTKKF
jgi:hypothetical protein